MRYSLPFAFLIGTSLYSPADATSWGLNSFSDSVYWSDQIVVVEVLRVVERHEPSNLLGKPLGKADISVRVLEQLKGDLPEEVRIDSLDLGDPTRRSSPYLPLPADLVGRKMLLFVRQSPDERVYEAYMRFLVVNSTAQQIAFFDLQKEQFPLKDLRPMIAQLNLIQAACPIYKFNVKNEAAALAACRTALHSQYDQVIWYGARRLLDREIPNDMLPDLLEALKRQESVFPVGYLLVQRLGELGEPDAVPALIDFLRKTPRSANDSYTVKALQRITAQDFGAEVDQWHHWWKEHATK